MVGSVNVGRPVWLLDHIQKLLLESEEHQNAVQLYEAAAVAPQTQRRYILSRSADIWRTGILQRPYTEFSPHDIDHRVCYALKTDKLGADTQWTLPRDGVLWREEIGRIRRMRAISSPKKGREIRNAARGKAG